jgi:hypothetical protein
MAPYLIPHLSVKNSARLNGVVWITEDKSLRNIGLFNTFQLNLHVLAAFDSGHLNLVRPELQIFLGKMFNESGSFICHQA